MKLRGKEERRGERERENGNTDGWKESERGARQGGEGAVRRVAAGAACGSYDIDFRYRHLVLCIFCLLPYVSDMGTMRRGHHRYSR